MRRILFARQEARPPASFSVAASEDDTAQMSVRRGGEEVYARTARIERLDEAELLATELDMSSSDTVFEDALGAAAGFLRSAEDALSRLPSVGPGSRRMPRAHRR